MTTITSKPVNPTAHLSPEDVEAIGERLDAIRQEVIDSRGESDARYIRRMVKAQRNLELGSRAVLLFSVLPPAWLIGTAGLSVAKILENMEIGHNVMHGQWDWMRDPKIHSTTWEWDNASPSEGWKHSHNEIHHTYTNIIGKDNDLGYGIMRVDEEQRWEPRFLAQPMWNVLNASIFEYGIAVYDMDLGRYLRSKTSGVREAWRTNPEFRRRAEGTIRKVRKQATKDYLVHPLLALPTGSFLPALAANAVANFVRNWWSHSVIMCGHFPEGVETFDLKSIPENETRGQWYLRQMLGSANISGSKAMHVMTGNLSHQIEHHLFPDLPSNRYAEIAPKVQEIFDEYGLSYCSRPLVPQVYSAWHKVVRLSFPNGWLETTNAKNLPSQVKLLWKLARADRRTRRRELKALEARAATKDEAQELATAA